MKNIQITNTDSSGETDISMLQQNSVDRQNTATQRKYSNCLIPQGNEALSGRRGREDSGCLLTVDYSDEEKQCVCLFVNVCVCVCSIVHRKWRMMGPCTGYATLASHHSSLL